MSSHLFTKTLSSLKRNSMEEEKEGDNFQTYPSRKLEKKIKVHKQSIKERFDIPGLISKKIKKNNTGESSSHWLHDKCPVKDIKIFVRGLPLDCDQKDLLECLSPNILATAHLSFSTAEIYAFSKAEAQSIVEKLNGYKIKGNTLRACLAESNATKIPSKTTRLEQKKEEEEEITEKKAINISSSDLSQRIKDSRPKVKYQQVSSLKSRIVKKQQ